MDVFFGDGDQEFLVALEREWAQFAETEVELPPANPAGITWEAFLLEYGPAWNGYDEHWPLFKHWFLHYADECELGAAARRFLKRANSRKDKIAAFAEHGVTIERPPAPEDPGPSYDEREWARFQVECGSAWDGTERTWPAFREWFLRCATQQDVGVPAIAFIDYVETQPDKVTVFELYEIPIAGPQPGSLTQPPPKPRQQAQRDQTLCITGGARRPRARSSSLQKAG
jgi:hypothetical protein